MAHASHVCALALVMAVAAPFAMTIGGCDQLNRPYGSPNGPNGANGPNGPNGSAAPADGDGGLSEPAPEPTLSARPGDIQL